MPEIILLETTAAKVTNIALTTGKGTFILSAINSIKTSKTNVTPISKPFLFLLLFAITIIFWLPALTILITTEENKIAPALFLIGASALIFFIAKWIKNFTEIYSYKLQLTVSSGEVTALECTDGNIVKAVEQAIMQGLARQK